MKKKLTLTSAGIAVAVLCILGVLAFGLPMLQTWLHSKENTLLEQEFIKSAASGVELNVGITIKKLRVGTSLGGAPTSPNEVVFMVLNHTTERVLFADHGYGLQVFSSDLKLNLWHTEVLGIHPMPGPITLPPNLETYDVAINNTWSISARELESLNRSEVRLYISGEGLNTGKRYGAYLDVTIQP